MNVKFRKYDIKTDFQKVSDFLVKHYLPGNKDGNFLQPAWEYMHSHPYLTDKLIDTIGVWEDSGEIVGIAHPEGFAGEAFFEVHPKYPKLKPVMLDYAEKHLGGKDPEGRMSVLAFINDFDTEFEALVRSRGYEIVSELNRPMTHLPIVNPFPPITVPEGFTLKSLAEDNNLSQISRVFWRGFNHGDEPPSDDIAGSKRMQSVPNYRKDLNIIIVAPDGNYVAYGGIWFEATNKYAYIEPVCTDPDYRRRGLGTAAVMESIRRCGELGATVAYVGSTQPFYQSMGFKKLFTCNCWRKYLNKD